MDLIRAKDGWVYVMRIVPKDELFVMIERPDMMDENLTADLPTWYLQHGPDLRRGRPSGPRTTRWPRSSSSASCCASPSPRCSTATTCSPTSSSRRATGGSATATCATRVSRTGSPATPAAPPRPGAGARGQRRAADRAAPAIAAGATVTAERPPLEGLRIIEVTTNWAGPVGRPVPRRPRRRQHQDRVGHPSGHAGAGLGRADAGPAAPAVAPGDVLLRDEPQQARRVHRPGHARRQGGVPRAGAHGRRRAGEQQRPGDAQPRPRLRAAARRSTRR